MTAASESAVCFVRRAGEFFFLICASAFILRVCIVYVSLRSCFMFCLYKRSGVLMMKCKQNPAAAVADVVASFHANARVKCCKCLLFCASPTSQQHRSDALHHSIIGTTVCTRARVYVYSE